jgi:acrylyl-CoA reductase (NADPH)
MPRPNVLLFMPEGINVLASAARPVCALGVRVRAVVISEANGGVATFVRDVDDAELPEGDVTVAIEYSTVNFKDALAMLRGRPVVRSFPMVPGVDFAGTVVSSEHDGWRPGDQVVLNGWGVGEERWGGLAQRARVHGEWLIAKPADLSTRDCMVLGTAGFTAMLAVRALQQEGLDARDGPVLVTGATGGVGSFAIAILASLGIDVIAATGKSRAAQYLNELGARDIIDRDELGANLRPLSKQRWQAAIDNVGGAVLAGVISATQYGGTVVACGNAGSMDLPTSVAPFILRGVRLVGIESVRAPIPARVDAWKRLSELLPRDLIEAVGREIRLHESIDAAATMLAGENTGRVVVDVRN